MSRPAPLLRPALALPALLLLPALLAASELTEKREAGPAAFHEAPPYPQARYPAPAPYSPAPYPPAPQVTVLHFCDPQLDQTKSV